MTKPTIDIDKPADGDIIGEGAQNIRETRQALYDIFPINPADLDYADTSNWWPAGSLTGGMDPAVDNDNPPSSNEFQDRAFLIGQKELRWDYAIPSGSNAISPGPVDVGSATVTVPEGSTWTIVGVEDTDIHYLRDLEDVNTDVLENGYALVYDEESNSWYSGPGPGGGFNYMGEVATTTDLPGYPNSYTGRVGDAYYVQDISHLFVWSSLGRWDDFGTIWGGEFDPTQAQEVTGAWTFTNPGSSYVGDGSGLTNLPPPDLSAYATKTYSDDGDASTLSSAKSYADTGDSTTLSSANLYADSGDATTLSSAKSYTDTKIGQIPAGVALDNNQPWTYGQHNAMVSPAHSNPGTGSSRFNWNAQQKPVVICSDATAPTTTVFPDAPTVEGMFISITWVSTGSQVWAWDDSVFDSKLGPPEDDGEDVTRVFVSRNNKWTDVA